MRCCCGSVFGVVLMWVAGTHVPAQEPDFPGPAPEHELLARFVGEWDVRSECDGGPDGGPDGAPMVSTGKLTGRRLGERWAVCDVTLDAEGTPVNAMLTVGYDPSQGRYVGTWTDSMLNHLWVYQGDYDAETRTLTLHTTGPNFMTGAGDAKFRDAYEFVSDDEIVGRSYAEGEDGEPIVFMTTRYRRVAP